MTRWLAAPGLAAIRDLYVSTIRDGKPAPELLTLAAPKPRPRGR